jgi:hypothetical protein
LIYRAERPISTAASVIRPGEVAVTPSMKAVVYRVFLTTITMREIRATSRHDDRYIPGEAKASGQPPGRCPIKARLLVSDELYAGNPAQAIHEFLFCQSQQYEPLPKSNAPILTQVRKNKQLINGGEVISIEADEPE